MSKKTVSLSLKVGIELDPETWAEEYGCEVGDVQADATELLASLLLQGLDHHKYLLDRVAIQEGREVVAKWQEGETA